MKKQLFTTTLAVGLALASPSYATTASDEIKGAFADWRNALSSGDPAKIVGLYETDATLLATLAEQPIRNQEERLTYFSTLLGNPNLVATVNDEAIRVLDDNTAAVSGIYTFSFDSNGTKNEIPARYTFVFEKRDGKWLIVEHHSSQMPNAP